MHHNMALNCRVLAILHLFLGSAGVEGSPEPRKLEEDYDYDPSDMEGGQEEWMSKSCEEGKMECWSQAYKADGEPDYESMPTTSCVDETAGCPCDADHEEKCSMGPNAADSYCLAKFYGDSCPKDCGAESSCWHSDGTETCSTNNECTCLEGEVSCPSAYPEYGASNECYPSDFGECPKVCAEGEMSCYVEDFDQDGYMIWKEGDCQAVDDGYCPIICGGNATKCSDGWGDFCVPLSDECPMTCDEGKMLSYVPIFDADGEWDGDEEKCCDTDQHGYPDCGCGSTAKKCTDTWGSFCVSKSESCPVSCNWETEVLCEAQSFDADGELLLAAGASSAGTCLKKGAECACGDNAMWCSVSDGDYSFGWCQPAKIDGVSEQCPVDCDWSKEELCYSCDYDADGEETQCTESCMAVGGTCPCGENTLSCEDEWGAWCMPKMIGGTTAQCPVTCTSSQKECYYNSFSSDGEWTGFTQECVASSSNCDCSKGTNAKPCTHTDPYYGTFTDCIATSDFCPPSCPAEKVICWEVDNFDASGNYLSTSHPTVSCAASHADCPCGQGAKKCGGDCFPKTMECPMTCTDDKRLCYIANFDDSGRFLGEHQKCVAYEEKCPCGAKSRHCDGEDWCTPTVSPCACSSGQEKCVQEHFNADGTVDTLLEVCVAKNASCPPGRNSMACTDPEDPTFKTYHPKKTPDGKTFKCPKPCTASDEAAGKETCYQENLDSNGEFLSESVTCVQAGGCKPGTGMKNCSVGCAVISVGESCVDNYGVTSCSTPAVKSDTRETAKIVIEFSETSGSAAAGLAAKKAKIGLDARGQPPAAIKTKAQLIPKSGRRLANGRRLATSGAKLVYEVQNVGATPVAPSKIAAEVAKQIKANNTKMARILNSLGKVNLQKGVAVALNSKKVTAVAGTNADSGSNNNMISSTQALPTASGVARFYLVLVMTFFCFAADH